MGSLWRKFWRKSPGAASINTPIAVLILGILVISILAGYSLGFNTSYHSGDEVYFNKSLGVRVSSYSSQGEPEFMIFVKDRGGRPLKVIYSLYAWMPDGSFEHLGIYGGFGIVKINYSVIRKFSKVWRDHLASMGNDPRIILPGILLMGAIHEKSGVYDGLKSVPIRVVDILANKSVAIEVIEDLEGRRPLIEYNGTNTSRSKAPAPQSIVFQDSWPPETITEQCYISGCFYWQLEEVYGYATGMLPVVVTYVYGYGSYMVYFVNHRIIFKSTSTVSLDFLISGSVDRQGIISYEIPGPSTSLKNDTVWLDIGYTFFNGWNFSPPAIIGTGFKADIAAARYRLHAFSCSSRGGCAVFVHDVTANMTLARPVIIYGRMEPMVEIDNNPYDNQGVSEIAFRYYRDYWLFSNTKIGTGVVEIDNFNVQNDLGGIPMELSITGAALAILCATVELPICAALATIASIIGVSMGATVSSQLYEYVRASIALKSEYLGKGYIYANYLYSPDAFEYYREGRYIGKYRIGSLYVDAYIHDPNYPRI